MNETRARFLAEPSPHQPPQDAASVVPCSNDSVHQLARVLGRLGDAKARERDAFAQVLGEATAAWWMRRAETFEWARPRPDDFRGSASDAAIAELDRRLAATAVACRRHAALLVERGPSAEDYALLEEVLNDARSDL